MIKSSEEIDKMRIASQLAAQVLEMITPHVIPGVTTGKLEQLCRRFIIEDLDAIPSTLGQQGFPACICTSVNHVVCHGIPQHHKPLQNGDILNIDVTVKKDGFIGDTSKMFLVGKVAAYAQRLVQVTQECLYLGIEQVKPGAHLGDIGHAIASHAHRNRYTVVEEYGGHGIGKEMWESPHIHHFGKAGTGLVLQEGITFTIEPMINLGSKQVRTLADGWTVVTRDHKLSAQWEHTILVTKQGYEILTLRQEEKEGKYSLHSLKNDLINNQI